MAKDLDGKVFLVTGATEGIGKAAARQFAARGATLIIVARSKEKGERVVAELGAGVPDAKVELLVYDLSIIADMRACAAAFKAKYDRLDVLVNNAGGIFQKKQLSADGIELTFALNHVGYHVLTRDLLDVLRKTPSARIVSTASGVHKAGKIDFADIATRPSGKVGFAAYYDSKLANVLFTRELARRLAGSGVTANCYHPGFVQTGFGKNNKGFFGWMISASSALVARKPEKGAETLVWLATSPEAAAFSGEYFYDKKVATTSALAKDDALAAKLWEFTEKLAG